MAEVDPTLTAIEKALLRAVPGATPEHVEIFLTDIAAAITFGGATPTGSGVLYDAVCEAASHVPARRVQRDAEREARHRAAELAQTAAAAS